jgi:hypothetical protein
MLPPDINKSEPGFVLEPLTEGGHGIRFGLAMVKNVGYGAAESIIATRAETDGVFASLDDFCRRLNTREVNKRALESLVKVGALDSVAGGAQDAAPGSRRGALLVNLDRMISIAQGAQRLRETGQATMFDLFGAEVATPLSGIDLESRPVPRSQVLAWEKELLGYSTEHPFTPAAPHLVPHVTALCNEITPELLADLPPQGRDFVLAGAVRSTRRLATRDGRAFIAAEIEDLSGGVEITVWPDVYERTSELWLAGSIVLVQVRVRERGDRLSAGVQEVVPFTEDFAPPSWLSAANTETRPRYGNGFGNGNGQRGSLTPGPEPALSAVEGAFLGRAEEAPAPPTVFDAPPAAPALEPLQLVLQETEDEAADQRRLAALFRLLQSQPGADTVRLAIHTREGERIDLALPSAQLDEALREKLREALEGNLANSATTH